MGDFDLVGAFKHLHDRFDRMEDNIQEVRDMTIKSTTQLEHLVGNGQPGQIDKINDRIGGLEKFKEKSTGYLAALSGMLTIIGIVGHYMVDFFRVKH